jgi:hypothetical protein
MPETCPVCGGEVPLEHAAHLTVNTKTEDGVVDHYLCQSCYEAELRPLFA